MNRKTDKTSLVEEAPQSQAMDAKRTCSVPGKTWYELVYTFLVRGRTDSPKKQKTQYLVMWKFLDIRMRLRNFCWKMRPASFASEYYKDPKIFGGMLSLGLPKLQNFFAQIFETEHISWETLGHRSDY